MRIDKVNITNYKCFAGKFSIEFSDGVNIIVGDNESGKSTILEAINMALSGILNGKYVKNEISQYLFNYEIVEKFINDLHSGNNPIPPEIVIEIFFSQDSHPIFEGNGNSERKNASGFSFKIEMNPDYEDAYQAYISEPQNITTLPIEYYHVNWTSFARNGISTRNIPIKSVLIDSSLIRYQNGSDVYLSKIIHDDLEDIERVKLSQAFRLFKQDFQANDSVVEINKKIQSKAKITNKNIKISVDLSTQNSWETTLITFLDDVPFHQIGKGEQCIIKTNLALGYQKSQEANLILIEEPENHLSHTKLNGLINNISENCINKQVIVTTHSSFVANKLGLQNLILLNNHYTMRLSNLSEDTYSFFKKLPGYNTLRLLLCKKAVLVEGDSDELIFQKAYMKSNNNHLPIEDGIDVISVKLSFLRFLEIADQIKLHVAVITDNDGDYKNNIEKKYSKYSGNDKIKIFADIRNDLNTLEPQFIDKNKENLVQLCNILSLDSNKFASPEMLQKFMVNHKTYWALKVFEDNKTNNIMFPDYFYHAVEWCNE